MMKFLIKNIFIIIVLVVGFLASRTLLTQSGYFNMHDDLQMMRQLSMEKCFKDGQIPCRWIGDMGYGYGFPLFNFYPPLPYLVGQVFRVVGFSYVDVVKITFALSIILSGVGMYFLGKEVFKNKYAGLVSAIFYVWAPYHSVDVYVRGAMNESWALVFFPLIFLFSYKLINLKDGSKYIIPLALSYAGLFMSHNLMVLIFTPYFIVWCLVWIYLNDWKNLFLNIKNLGFSGLLGLGLSAYFTLPAIFENKLTWLKSQLIGYYDYSAHFVTIKQLLISRFWGYGPSVWLEEDGMPFQIGHLHWIFSIVIILVATYLFFKKKTIQRTTYVSLIFLFVMGWTAAFMTHVRSTPIYIMFDFIALVQFPWRFLTLIIFAFSLLSGALVLIIEKLNSKYAVTVPILVSTALIVLNWNYFLPLSGKMGELTDKQKFSAAAWDLQQTAGIYDYLPLTAKMAPKAPQKVLAEVMKGEVVLSNMTQGTDWAKFETNGESSTIRINIFEFPNWEIKIDGKKANQFVPEEEEWGRMWVEVPEGKHLVEAKFKNTPVRTISNIISLFSWLGLGVYLMLQFRRGRRN